MAPSQAGYEPTLEKFLKSIKGQSLEASTEGFISLLKRRQIRGAEACAVATARVMLQVVAKSKWTDVDQLLANVQKAGARLVQAQPREPVISNIVRRILGLIRDEAQEDRNGDNEGLMESVSDIQSLQPESQEQTSNSSEPRSRPGPTPIKASLTPAASFVSKSLFNLLSLVDPADSFNTSSPVTGASTPNLQSSNPSVHALKSEVIDGIEEIMDELHQVSDQIASFADVHIHNGDHILAYQPSPTVEKFLIRAASKRNFTAMIASGTPPANGAEAYGSLKKKLTAAGCKVVHIMSSSYMAYMPKVNKVILPARAILANGAVIVDGGALVVARAAKEYSKPVIVLAGIYKLCPENSSDMEDPIELGPSDAYLTFTDGPLVRGADVESVVCELVPPELVDAYITNLGTHTRDHLDDLLADHYKIEDINFPLH